MNEVITRGTLNESLETWSRLIIDKVSERFDKLARDVQTLAAAIAGTRSELGEEIRAVEKRLGAELKQQADAIAATHSEIRAVEKHLSAELKHHVNANGEALRGQMGALDDKYKDLPARVTILEELPERVSKLEATVFAPKRKRRT